MKRIRRFFEMFIILFLIVGTIIYLISAFINFDFNPLNWDINKGRFDKTDWKAIRIQLGMIGIMPLVISIAYAFDDEFHEEHEAEEQATHNKTIE